ncbi:hypothetical protein MLD38_013138 [Melastoma candidum]|uniref:Uncharacterized protein n=2 Tax=Melastoma candidum TaxID=119954 RepID=A0ACB9RC92_9MYRT|nr:hypothetical protein MLD38_013138 [Melastoma candidum]
MYVTRLLSASRRSSSNGSMDKPKDGPFSGYLTITDREAIEENTCCWGTCKSDSVTKFPFPQDRFLDLQPDNEDISRKLWFLPVLGTPLSSDTYYVICAEGKHKGSSLVCSREADKVPGCFGKSIQDMKPRPFDYQDDYQKFKIIQSRAHNFHAESVASDGFPSIYLRHKSWDVRTSYTYQPQVEGASGLDASQRAHLPDFSFPISNKSSDPVTVGKWYCPFVFFMEDGGIRDQMKRSLFYKMLLKQRWEKIYTSESMNYRTKQVTVNVNIQREGVSIFGMKAEEDHRVGPDRLVWFRQLTGENTQRGARLGMSTAILENMKWLQKEGGYMDSDGAREENLEVVVKAERGTGEECKGFCCYVLVESFVLMRLNGTPVMMYEFRHTDKVRVKWE